MEIKNIGQLVEHLAKKAGVEATDANLVNILSNAELSKAPIHSDLVSAIDNNLLSESTAMDNHPKLKNHYHAQALNSLDRKLEEVMAEAGLSDEKIAELKAVKSSYARTDAVIKAIADAAATKSKGAGAEDKSALQKQVDDLLAKLGTADTNATQKIAEIEGLRKNDRIRYELRSMLTSVKTVFDEMSAEVKNATLDTLITKALQDKKASFDFDDNGTFLLKGEGDTAVLGANQTKYTPQTFIDEVLAQNKVLQTVPPQGDGGSNPPSGGGAPTRVKADTKPINGNNQTTASINRRLRERAEDAGS